MNVASTINHATCKPLSEHLRENPQPALVKIQEQYETPASIPSQPKQGEIR